MNEEIIYFNVNNWFYKKDYPPISEEFSKWICKGYFMNDEWCKEQRLCVVACNIDMSINYCISAPRSWVEKNCPQLLTDDEYTYYIIYHKYDPKTGGTIEEKRTVKKKYSDFVFKPKREGGTVTGKFGWAFPKYCEENIGVYWCDDED